MAKFRAARRLWARIMREQLTMNPPSECETATSVNEGHALPEPLTHDTRPESTSRAKFCDLFEQVVVRVKEERQTRSEVINLETGAQCRFDVSDSVCDGESNFLNSSRAGFANVITTNRDRVPVWNFAGAKLEDVSN